jgi:hypothetical protein
MKDEEHNAVKALGIIQYDKATSEYTTIVFTCTVLPSSIISYSSDMSSKTL